MLIVDDDALTARAVARLAKVRGFEAVVVTATTEMAVVEGTFDVAIVDLNIGEASGLELARRLLADERASRVVFHSGTEDHQLLEDAMALAPVVRKGARSTHALMALLTKDGVAS